MRETNDHVHLPAEAMQQRRPHGKERAVQRGARGCTERHDVPCEAPIEVHRMVAACRGLHVGPWPIQRQVQCLRCAHEQRHPPRQRRVVMSARVLPHRKVGILKLKWRQRGRRPMK